MSRVTNENDGSAQDKRDDNDGIPAYCTIAQESAASSTFDDGDSIALAMSTLKELLTS